MRERRVKGEEKKRESSWKDNGQMRERCVASEGKERDRKKKGE